MRSSTKYIRFTMLMATVLVAGVQAGAQPPSPAPSQERSSVFVAIYERGPKWDATKEALQQTGIADHMQFLRGNADKLVAAAPFQQGLAAGGRDRTVGMVIVLAPAQDEAEKLVAGDPAIASGLMTAAVRRWLVERVRAH